MTALPPIDADAGRLEVLRRLPGGERGPEARRAAANELQVMFLTQLIRAMRETVPENDLLPRSPARSVYEGAFDRSVAEAMAARDPFGLVRALGESAGGLKFDGDGADNSDGSPGSTGRDGREP